MRDQATLQRWVDQFIEMGYPVAGSLRVLHHDDEDAGLIKLELRSENTTRVIHPPCDNETAWRVIFEAREVDIALSAAQTVQPGTELAVAGALCIFPEVKDIDVT